MIHRVHIQNFKSIADVTVELEPVTVLVGRSGTGKSNFVQALRALRDVLINPQSLGTSWSRIRPAVPTDEPTTFGIEFSVPGFESRFTYELSFAAGGPMQAPRNEILTLGGKSLFHQAAELPAGARWKVEPALVRPPQAGAIALGRLPALSEVTIAFTALTAGIGCYSFSDRVLTQANRNATERGLSEDGANHLLVIKDILLDLQNSPPRQVIVALLQHMNPAIVSVELDSIQDPRAVLVGHGVNGKTLILDLAQESDGLRRLYAHLLALYQRPPKQTLLFEHPEDGIHPGALCLLADEFQAAPGSGKGQVIVTTHSPGFLDSFSAGQIRVVELQGFETRIGPLSPEQRESLEERLLEPGELLTVDPARLAAEPAL